MSALSKFAAMIGGLLGFMRGGTKKGDGKRQQAFNGVPVGAFGGGRYTPLYRPMMSQNKRRRLERGSHR